MKNMAHKFVFHTERTRKIEAIVPCNHPDDPPGLSEDDKSVYKVTIVDHFDSSEEKKCSPADYVAIKGPVGVSVHVILRDWPAIKAAVEATIEEWQKRHGKEEKPLDDTPQETHGHP